MAIISNKKKIALPPGTVVPNHIAIILDGNRRWARARGLSSIDGHKAGYKAMKEVIYACRSMGVHTLTVWGFSTENWERPKSEVLKIMKLVSQALSELKVDLFENQVRFVHLGRKDRLPEFVLKQIVELEKKTAHFDKHLLNMALDYGGHDEILRAVKAIIKDNISQSQINEQLFESYLDTHNQPYPKPDLFIRTSGEQRTSGFMPWQMAYSEFLWIDKHLPDVTVSDVVSGILDYSRRRRRFGGNDSVAHLSFRPSVTAKLELSWWRLNKVPEGELASYIANHIKEQWGISKKHALLAAKFMSLALIEGESSKWVRAKKHMVNFYKLIRQEVGLAFEPKLVAGLQVSLWQKTKGADLSNASEIEETTRTYLSEVYRISDLQARKAAHLMSSAFLESQKARSGLGEKHWKKTEEYLEQYYAALKDKVS